MLLVLLVVMSVISGDRKLTKARQTIHKWSMEVKDVFMKEAADFRQDWKDFSSGMLLLTYEGEISSSDYVRDDEIFDKEQNIVDKTTTSKQRRRRKPKSIIFRLAVSPLKKLSKKKSWSRKKKTNINEEEGPSANYYVPPSKNFEVV